MKASLESAAYSLSRVRERVRVRGATSAPRAESIRRQEINSPSPPAPLLRAGAGRRPPHVVRASVGLSALLATALLAACATAAKVTLEDRFQAIGIPQGTAECMVDDLDERLSDDDLQDLARYSVRLARAKSTADAIRSLMQIDNPRAVTAIGRSAVSCVTGFRP